MNRETTINALHYIADSTVERADGGFHPTTIEIAKDALELIGELSIYREICEAAAMLTMSSSYAMIPNGDAVMVVYRKNDTTYSETFDNLPKAFEFVKGTGSRWEFIEKATKDIDSWTDSEKAEIHPQRALNSTLKNVKKCKENDE